MSRVRVKICGITSPEDGRAAAEAGADAIGLVFWEKSPRAVDLRRAREIARAVPPLVLRVGVFVDAPAEEMARAAEAAGLDLLQLHGDEPPSACEGLPCRALKSLRVGPHFEVAEAERYLGRAAGLLVDARSDVGPGGTGALCDWESARRIRARAEWLMLAGGLTPENVGAAIAAVEPDAVDVSSGVESAPGRKDPARMRAFVEAVRACPSPRGQGER